MIITSFAYESTWYLGFNDGATVTLEGNHKLAHYHNNSGIESFTWQLDNGDPYIFTNGMMYTFDVVLFVMFPKIDYFSSTSTYRSAINDLVTNGFSTSWYSHYVFDTTNIEAIYSDGSGQFHNFSLGGIDVNSDYQYYVSSDECRVAYHGIVYNGTIDDMLTRDINAERLCIQQKVHFQFTTRDIIKDIGLYWYFYNFGNSSTVDTLTEWGGDFGVSDMVVMDNSVAQAEVNILASLSNVSSQVSALQSSMDTLLEQTDFYLDLLTADWDTARMWNEPYYDDVEGILPQIYLYLWDLYDTTEGIYSRINTTNNRLNTINTTISTQTTTLSNIFNNSRSSNFWTWLDSNFDTINQDIITTNDYLADICESAGLNDTETQNNITTVSETLKSSENSLTTLTSSFVTVDSSTYSTVTNFLDDLTFMDGDNLNATWSIFNTSFNLFNFGIGGIGILTCFVLYKLITKIWGQLFFDE